MQGENLSRLLTQGRGPARVIYCEGGIYQPQPWRMAVRGNYKLVSDAALSPTQLYDLAADPYELDNRVAATSERRNRGELQSLLRQWTARTGQCSVSEVRAQKRPTEASISSAYFTPTSSSWLNMVERFFR